MWIFDVLTQEDKVVYVSLSLLMSLLMLIPVSLSVLFPSPFPAKAQVYEKVSLQGIQQLVHRCYQTLALLKLLCDHQFSLIMSELPKVHHKQMLIHYLCINHPRNTRTFSSLNTVYNVFSPWFLLLLLNLPLFLFSGVSGADEGSKF